MNESLWQGDGRGCLSETSTAWMWVLFVFTLPPPDLLHLPLCFMLQCARRQIWCVKRGLKSFTVHYSCDVDVSKAVRCYLCLSCFCILLSLLLFITGTELESLHPPATMSTLEFVFFYCHTVSWHCEMWSSPLMHMLGTTGVHILCKLAV